MAQDDQSNSKSDSDKSDGMEEFLTDLVVNDREVSVSDRVLPVTGFGSLADEPLLEQNRVKRPVRYWPNLA